MGSAISPHLAGALGDLIGIDSRPDGQREPEHTGRGGAKNHGTDQHGGALFDVAVIELADADDHRREHRRQRRILACRVEMTVRWSVSAVSDRAPIVRLRWYWRHGHAAEGSATGTAELRGLVIARSAGATEPRSVSMK